MNALRFCASHGGVCTDSKWKPLLHQQEKSSSKPSCCHVHLLSLSCTCLHSVLHERTYDAKHADGKTNKCQHSALVMMRMMSKQHWILRTWLFLYLLVQKVYCFLPAPQNVTVISFNLEHKLTWRLGPGSPPFVHFRVQVYRNKRKLWVPVSNCSDLQMGEPCDLTTSFKNVYGYHLAQVQSFTTDHESNWTSSKFFHPLLETTVGPPVVSLTGCGNCLLLQLSPPTSRGLHHGLVEYFFREYTVNVSRTRDKAQFTIRASSGETLINYLETGAQYCITALPLPNINMKALPSGPHCAFTSQESVGTVPVILGLLCVLLVLAILGSAALISNGQLHHLHKHLSRTMKTPGAQEPSAAYMLALEPRGT
uniref:Interferon/interleukin receptor domain-containing protein n=1 Tax=Electrophorus electricus TaxID=8005 RepID=A0A4W4DUZ6_ELEEL